MKQRTLGSFCAAAIASLMPVAAFADSQLAFRGGVSVSTAEYPYAVNAAAPPTIDEVFNSDYGWGGYLSATYSQDDVLGNFGIEASLSFAALLGDDNVGLGPPGDSNCTLEVNDVLTVSHGACMDGAEISNTAIAIQARALASHSYANSGVEVLAGLGALSFQNEMAGMMIYPGESSNQFREADFRGLGIVVGARTSIPVSNVWSVGVEGFAGVYRGRRDLSIRDEYVGILGALDVDEIATAYSLDLAVSVQREATLFDQTGQLEFGVGYTAIFDAVNTANYNTGFATGANSPTGSISDDFSAVNLFVGYAVSF